MSRRSHKKSRNGCVDCKLRHIKCDETLPTCVNCRTADRVCSFGNQQSPEPRAQAYPSPATTSGSVQTPTALHEPIQLNNPQFVVNTDHMELLCNFCTETMKDFQPTHAQLQTPFAPFQRHISSAPYLLHEILAISALHLSLTRPEQAVYYHDYTVGLQTRALSLFSSTVQEIDKDNCQPAIMFCALVGIHALGETLRRRQGDLNTFLDSFTHFFRLHRGVLTVASAAWDFLRQTELGASLTTPERIAEVAYTGTECDSLNRMLQEADLGPKSLKTYQIAVKHLQWAFDMDRCAQTMPESKQMLFAWTILVPPEYTDLLMQRRPEALIILAHYGVILHRHSNFWVVDDGGEFLIRSIVNSLGPYWERWLEFPSAAIAQSDVDFTT